MNNLSSNAHLHLTLEERYIILTGIKNGSTKTAIAKTLGKEKSTIGKEIKLHRVLSHKSSYSLQCAKIKSCKNRMTHLCTSSCPDYSPFVCKRRDRSPGACNGCSKSSSCRYDKYTYDPAHANCEYRRNLVDSRVGVNLTTKEAKAMADIIGPLLRQGQSPYEIINNHPELGICEKTLYNYIESDVFHEISGITVMDLRRKVSRKISKKNSVVYKKREDRKFLIGRKYDDYKAYISENPEAFVLQMDTVYNDVTNGPFIQTFKFVKSGILFALFHEDKTAETMLNGLVTLENILSKDIFEKYANVVLTDRGSEFSYAERMETRDDGSRRTRVYYCDPMQAGQKGTLENKHIELRYILPKETDLRALGLTGQDKLNIALSNVNSHSVESLGGKSPMELTEFLYPDLYEKLVEFGITKIEKDRVILAPYLLKNR